LKYLKNIEDVTFSNCDKITDDGIIALVRSNPVHTIWLSRIDECWGKPQNVRVSDLKGKIIRITLPEKDTKSQSKSGDSEENEKALQNIVNHAKQRGVDIAFS